MALTKADLTDRITKTLNIEKQDAKQLVDSFFEEIRFALVDGKTVKLSGFGNFTARDKKMRPGRNPKTGENVSILARRVVTFRPGIKFRERIENNFN